MTKCELHSVCKELHNRFHEFCTKVTLLSVFLGEGIYATVNSREEQLSFFSGFPQRQLWSKHRGSVVLWFASLSLSKYLLSSEITFRIVSCHCLQCNFFLLWFQTFPHFPMSSPIPSPVRTIDSSVYNLHNVPSLNSFAWILPLFYPNHLTGHLKFHFKVFIRHVLHPLKYYILTLKLV